MSFTSHAGHKHIKIFQMVTISFWEDLLAFEKFMKVCLGGDVRDKFAERRGRKTQQVLSAGFTLSSLDNSCVWGGLFLFTFSLQHITVIETC